MPNSPQNNEAFDFEKYNKAVAEEFNVESKFDLAEKAKDFLDSSTMPALRTISALAQHSPNERVRLDAAKWLAEHTVFGADGKKNTTENTLSKVMRRTSAIENE